MRWALALLFVFAAEAAIADSHIVVELTEARIDMSGGQQPAAVTLLVRSDGQMSVTEADGKVRTGTLRPRQVNAIRDALKKTRLVLGKTFNACDAMATRHYHLVTERGLLDWETPCNPAPDASVGTLLVMTRDVIAGRR